MNSGTVRQRPDYLVKSCFRQPAGSRSEGCALNDGGCVLSVCTEDDHELDQIGNAFQRHNATFVFRFGTLTTKAL